ncbi:hypothetical protein, partial [uncultured Mitsuokella sp.]|uniref:hypothetical protein n=1 Tax=uncultured Mitsuokella sp. TaxID=453120 RepID=UPI00259341DD
MDIVISKGAVRRSLECICPGVLRHSAFGNLIRICGVAGIGIAEEIISQYSILGIPVHQPAFGAIYRIAILGIIKGRAIGGGHIPHRQVKVCWIHSDGAATGDLIVGGSIAAIASLYLCTGSQILVFIFAYMGRIVA